MKSSYALVLTATALILNGCIKVTSVAGKWKSDRSGAGGSSLASGDASGSNEESSDPGSDESGGEDVASEEGSSEEESGGTSEESSGDSGGAAVTGDAEKGAQLVSTCKACHAQGGAAAKVVLGPSSVSALDKAAPGGEKESFHATVKSSFSDTNRPDLEAALKAL